VARKFLPSFLGSFTPGVLSTTFINVEGGGLLGGYVVLMRGDSNTVGEADTDTADNTFAVTTPYTLATITYSNNVGDPTTRVSATNVPVAPYAPGGAAGMGFEIGLAPALNERNVTSGLTPRIDKFGWFGRALDDWASNSTFPTNPVAGPNILTQADAQADATVASVGTAVMGYAWAGSGNDGTTLALANAYQARLTALMASERAKYGNFWLVLIQVHKDVSLSASPYRDTVRTAQVAYAATDPRCTLISIDDLQLNTDLIHYSANACIMIGHRVANALGKALVAGFTGNHITRYSATTPYVNGFSTIAKGTTSATPPIDPHEAGDWIYTHVEAITGTATGTIATPSGWTQVGAQQVGQQFGIWTISAVFRIKAANGATASPTLVTPANYAEILAITFNVRGANATTPEDFVSGNVVPSTTTTDVIIPGGTTSGPNRLIVTLCGGFMGGGGFHSLAGYAATGVTYTELYDSDVVPSTNHGGLALAYAQKASAGVVGTTTATYTASYSIWAGHVIAIQP
jgi:hypothetical protein